MKTRVLQVIDTLTPGGAERMAVNVANHLNRESFTPALATTWKRGELEAFLAPDMRFFPITAGARYSPAAVIGLAKLIDRERIDLVHAHANALFPALAAVRLARGRVPLVWHDHYGRLETRPRPAVLYRPALRGVDGVIGVSEKLVAWAVREMGVPAGRVWYLPNFVDFDPQAGELAAPLPGEQGLRVVCVANFRRQKDHATLLRAFAQVKAAVPQAHLLLVGEGNEAGVQDEVRSLTGQLGLGGSVHFLGQRMDVAAVLRQCDVGVLSSGSEAFPLTLIEYGLAGLGTAATDVGDCAAILQHGQAGMLVPPSRPDLLAGALQELLLDPDRRRQLGARLQRHVSAEYSRERFFERLEQIYQAVLPREGGW